MRIVVLGNCQAHGVAHGLAHLVPDATIQVAQVEAHPGSPRALAAAGLIEGCNAVFTQPFTASWGALATDSLVAAGLRVVPVPVVTFRGYHPDAVYLRHQGRRLASPVGEYHSALIAAAFALGVPEANVAPLFNRLVYARLGYLDAFGRARAVLERRLAAFAGQFESWHARGPFMHTANHPRVFVLAEIARAAAIGARLLPQDTPPVTPAFDHLANNTIWPVYPEIAEALGMQGGLVFKRAAPAGRADGLHLSLQTLIRESYARYAKLPEAVFQAEEIGAARAALAGLLRIGAG